jgi:hypothetical protein
MAKFYIGQPVVCVNGKPFRGATLLYPGLRWPVEGQHYRIRGMMDIRTRIGRTKWEPLTFVLLSGLYNHSIRWGDGRVAEAAFWEERFKPATDIESLRDLLKVREDA